MRVFGSGGGVRRAICLVGAVALVGSMLAGGGTAGAVRKVRGFDGTTITVAALGMKASVGSGETGARARIKRFNDTNEVKGVKISYAELADDKGDPAAALSEVRRLVTQTGIFALVGDVSAVLPADYLVQQHVPFFGGGFGPAYCSPSPTTKGWGYAVSGCFGNPDPSFINDTYLSFYTYVSKRTGKTHPTLVNFGQDSAGAKLSIHDGSIAAQGTGFKVVAQQNTIPISNVSDYTPFAQGILTADNGKPPDSVFCQADIECLPLWQLLQASGFKGVFGSGLYTNFLVKQLQGSSTQFTSQNFDSKNAGMDQVRADLDAFQPGAGARLDVGSFFGYVSADFFIQVLKKVAAKGKSNITPENVRKVASTFTWELPGVAGPTQFPKSTVQGFPACLSSMASDGTAWQTVVPYKCSTKTYSPKTKIK